MRQAPEGDLRGRPSGVAAAVYRGDATPWLVSLWHHSIRLGRCIPSVWFPAACSARQRPSRPCRPRAGAIRFTGGPGG